MQPQSRLLECIVFVLCSSIFVNESLLQASQATQEFNHSFEIAVAVNSHLTLIQEKVN